MIKREKELTPKPVIKDILVSNKLKSHVELVGYPIFPEGTKSLLHKYLTKEIWEQLCDVKDKFGFSFK